MGNRPSTTSLFQSSRDGRTRTDDTVLPRHVGLPLPYIPSVRTAGFEPAISWPPATRDTRLRYVLKRSVLAQALSQPDDGPRINVLSDSARSAHGRVKPFIAFTPVVGVSTAQQQAVVQRVFWVWLKRPVEHSHRTRPAFCSGKQSPGPLSGSSNAFRRPVYALRLCHTHGLLPLPKDWQLPGHFVVLHGNAPRWARSTIAALNPWSFRQHSAGGTAAHALSYLAASRSHAVIYRLHRRGHDG